MNVKRRLIALYAHLGNRTFSIYWQARKEAINLLNITSSDEVLEVGCGEGAWTAFSAPHAKTYTAFDIHFGSLKNAQLWLSPYRLESPVEKVRFLQSSAENLPFADNSFTKIASNDVIEHIPDQYRAVQEINRVLVKGGRVVVTTMLESRPSYVKRLEFPEHIREYTTESLCDLFVQAHMKIEHIFYFYYLPTMLTRELQVILFQTHLNKIRGVNFLLSIPLTGFAQLEHVTKLGKPGGIGVVATKV